MKTVYKLVKRFVRKRYPYDTGSYVRSFHAAMAAPTIMRTTVKTTFLDGVTPRKKNSSTITKTIVRRRRAVNMGTLTRPRDTSDTMTYAIKTKERGATCWEKRERAVGGR
jgi:hypothetical protein